MRKTTGYVRVVVVSGLAWMAAIGIGVAQTTRVSTDAVGAQVAGASRQPSASADGRFVAFSSTATTLVAGDTNGSADIFVKDRQTGAVTRVSVRTGGAEFVGDSVSPDISADGRYVTFVSAAFLTADDTNTLLCPGANVTGPSCPDVFRHDRITGETIRLSVSSAGVQADAASAAPRISGDGRFVVYESVATTLVAFDNNLRRDIFLRDAQTATTTRMSVATGEAQSDRDASAPSISDDGSRVSFLSDATTLDASPDPLACDAAVLPCTRVFVRTVAGATTTRLGFTVSLPGVSGIVAEAYRVRESVIAANGQSVAILAYGLVTTGSGQFSVDAFLAYSFAPGAPTAADVIGSTVGVRAPQLSSVAVDAAGRVRAFCAGEGSAFAALVFDMQTWVGGGSPQGLPDCEGVSLSADGLTLFFASSGGTPVAGDTNAAFDVFAADFDADDDGMSSGWENVFRLSDADPADALLDPDNDGVTNQQEFAAGTNPRGLFKYYLAEGAQNGFFNTEIAVFKPATAMTESVSMVAQFQGQNGRRTTSPILNLSTGPNSGDVFTFTDRVPRARDVPAARSGVLDAGGIRAPARRRADADLGRRHGCRLREPRRARRQRPGGDVVLRRRRDPRGLRPLLPAAESGDDDRDGHHHLPAAGPAGPDRARLHAAAATAAGRSTWTRSPASALPTSRRASTPPARSSPSARCT